MSYQNIEIMVKRDEEELKLKGQIRYYRKCADPRITIFKAEGGVCSVKRIPSGYTIPYEIPLSKLMDELNTLQKTFMGFRERRPQNYSVSVNLGEEKD